MLLECFIFALALWGLLRFLLGTAARSCAFCFFLGYPFFIWSLPTPPALSILSFWPVDEGTWNLTCIFLSCCCAAHMIFWCADALLFYRFGSIFRGLFQGWFTGWFCGYPIKAYQVLTAQFCLRSSSALQNKLARE